MGSYSRRNIKRFIPKGEVNMASYVVVPKALNISEIETKDFALSPSLFKRVEIKNQNIKRLKDLLIKAPVGGTEVGSHAYLKLKTDFKFIRTKAFPSYSFLPNLNINGSFEYLRPLDFENAKGKDGQRIIKENDVLFVTGGNVGEVVIADETLNKSIPSSHILNLSFDDKIKYYVFAFLKNDFCKIQSNFGPIGAIGGLDTFDKDTLLSISIPFPNKKNSDDIIKYVELLTKAIINKEKEIRRKHKLILEKIGKELLRNQKNNEFNYQFPTIKEIGDVGRFDTGLYSESFKKLDFLIRNYKHGASNLEELDYKITRGQNLQISNIGKSIYSEKPKLGFYRLLLSKHFTEFMTFVKDLYLGNPKKLKVIKKGEIIFSARGNLGRVLVFCDEIESTITNIDNIHITNLNRALFQNIFVGAFLNFLRINDYLSKVAITGSGADSFTKYQFNLLPIPNFPESKQKEIAELYYNPVNYPTGLNLANFLEEDAEWNKKAGILQLDLSGKELKERLNEVIHQIVMDEEVKIDFELVK